MSNNFGEGPPLPCDLFAFPSFPPSIPLQPTLTLSEHHDEHVDYLTRQEAPASAPYLPFDESTGQHLCSSSGNTPYLAPVDPNPSLLFQLPPSSPSFPDVYATTDSRLMHNSQDWTNYHETQLALPSAPAVGDHAHMEGTNNAQNSFVPQSDPSAQDVSTLYRRDQPQPLSYTATPPAHLTSTSRDWNFVPQSDPSVQDISALYGRDQPQPLVCTTTPPAHLTPASWNWNLLGSFQSRDLAPNFSSNSLGSNSDQSGGLGQSLSSVSTESSIQQLGAPLSCHHCLYATTHRPDFFQHVLEMHPELLTCQECGVKFADSETLKAHVQETKHSPFKCNNMNCNTTFKRIDIYRRHLRSHNPDAPRFPCEFCSKHRGDDAFDRKDKLSDHLRQYHKFETRSKGAKPSKKRRRKGL